MKNRTLAVCMGLIFASCTKTEVETKYLSDHPEKYELLYTATSSDTVYPFSREVYRWYSHSITIEVIRDDGSSLFRGMALQRISNDSVIINTRPAKKSILNDKMILESNNFTYKTVEVYKRL